MLITKPKENQILLEDEDLKNFELENKSDLGIDKTEFDKFYNGLILVYRLPGMSASKQLFRGNQLSIRTLIASSLDSLIRNEVLSEDDLDEMVYAIHASLHSIDD